jgi:chromosome condensin MukBEF MukE localization factor
MPEVCSQRSTAETSIARQRLVRHVSAATDRLVEIKALLHISAETDKHTITEELLDVVTVFGIKPKHKSKMRQKQRERARANRAESKESNKPKTTSAGRMKSYGSAAKLRHRVWRASRESRLLVGRRRRWI